MTHEEFVARFRYNTGQDQLGEGGFGKVYKAYDTYRDLWVAIKVADVKPGLEHVRLKNEVELVNKLSHPYIATYEDCFTFQLSNGVYDYGILQYYAAGNLLQLTESVKLSLAQKKSFLIRILEGLAFLHQQGIIHRDLKPQNVLIANRSGEYIPKITDFGISKLLDNNKSSLVSNSLVGAGTISYSSPEQLSGTQIRKNADLWSFGVLAFWLLVGRLPFTSGSFAVHSEAGRAEVFRQISQGLRIEDLKGLDPAWSNLLQQCLVNDPEHRIKSARACLELLHAGTTSNSGYVREDSNTNQSHTHVRTSNKNASLPVEKSGSFVSLVRDNLALSIILLLEVLSFIYLESVYG